MYALVAVYKGRVSVLVTGLSFKQAYVMRSKYSHYPHRSIEIRRA